MKNKIIASILIVSMFATPLSFAHAGTWGEAMAAAKMKQMMEEIAEQIKNAINAAAKMAAIKQATSTIEDLLYGGSSSPRSIHNFESFLIEQPLDAAATYASDFLTEVMRGRGSSDYTSSNSSTGRSLSDDLESIGRQAVKYWEYGNGDNYVDYMDYCSNSSSGDAMYFTGEQGYSYGCFSAVMENPLNTPIGLSQAINSAAVTKYETEKEIAKLVATSSGTLPQFDESGNVTLTSDMVAAIARSQAMLPLEALANGDSNVFSSLIQSFAITLLTRIVNEGLSEAEEAFKKNSDAFQKNFEDEFGNLNESGSTMRHGDYDDYMMDF